MFAAIEASVSHMLCRTHAVTAINKRIKETLPAAQYVFLERKAAKLYVRESWSRFLQCTSAEAADAFFHVCMAELEDPENSHTTWDALLPHVRAAAEMQEGELDMDEAEHCVKTISRPIISVFTYIQNNYVKYAANLCKFGVPEEFFAHGPNGSNNYAESMNNKFDAYLKNEDHVHGSSDIMSL